MGGVVQNISGWPWTSYVTEGGFQLFVLLPGLLGARDQAQGFTL